MGIPDRESSNDHLRDTADQSSVPAPPTITGQLLKSVRLCLMGIICLMATLFFAGYYTLFYRHKNNPWLFCRVVSIPVLFVLGIKVKVRNIERLSAHQPCIILSNHQSNYDTFVTGRVLPQGFAATGKKDIKRI